MKYRESVVSKQGHSMHIGIIGCGVMGGAIARIASHHHNVILHDHKKTNATPLAREIGAKVELDLGKLSEGSDVVILAVKPKDLKVISEPIASHLSKGQLVVSILAGITLETLQMHFPNSTVFRVMPNLPLVCGHGMLGIVDDPEVKNEEKHRVEEALKGLGTISWMNEGLMNAFTALTSSNPAFIYLIIEAMVEAGVSLGFKADMALEYVLKTLEGSVALLKTSGVSPTELKMRITSPGGATIAGLNELESQGVRAGIIAGLKACYRRAEEMGGS